LPAGYTVGSLSLYVREISSGFFVVGDE